MKYLLLAWSEGNVAAKAGKQQRACPHQIGQLREAWMKGWSVGRAVKDGYERTATAARARRRLAA
jgi:ribosome modulation factor